MVEPQGGCQFQGACEGCTTSARHRAEQEREGGAAKCEAEWCPLFRSGRFSGRRRGRSGFCAQ
jgi:hypothetical protein